MGFLVVKLYFLVYIIEEMWFVIRDFTTDLIF